MSRESSVGAKNLLRLVWLVRFAVVCCVLSLVSGLGGTMRGMAAEPWEATVQQPVLGPEHALAELRRFFTPRIAEFTPVARAEDWPARATALREEILRKVVLRGRAAEWQQRPVRVEWLEERPGGAT